MTTIAKTIITAALLLLTICLFSQDSTDDKAIVKDVNGISTGMTQKEFDQFKKDYYNKMEKLGMFELPEHRKKNGKTVETEEGKLHNLKVAMMYKINLNAVDKFKEIGFDIVETIKTHFLYRHSDYETEKNIMRYNTIVVGEVIDSLIILNTAPHLCFNSVFKVKVHQFIKGQENFKGNLPDTLVIYMTEGAPGCTNTVFAFMGMKRIFMLSSTSKNYNKMKETIKYCTSPELKKYSTNLNDPTVIYSYWGYGLNSLDEIQMKVNLIEEINKPEDFYRRKY